MIIKEATDSPGHFGPCTAAFQLSTTSAPGR